MECGLSIKDDHVIGGSEDGSVYIWDLVDATVKHTLKVRNNRAPHSMAMHPEDNCMLVACENQIYLFTGDEYALPSDEPMQ